MEESFDRHQLKWANALLDLRKSESTNAEDDPKKVKEAITNKYADREPQEINWEERARKSGTIELYTAVYRFASGNGLHANMKALEKHISIDKSGGPQGFKFAPDESDINITLQFACSAMMTALGSVLDKLPLSSHRDEFSACLEDLKKG